MSDKIIDFNELKNKVKDKDVDKFEEYIYSMYYKLAEGKMNMADFSKNIMSYMQENNISQDKLINIQKKFLERYGIDPSTIEEQFNIPGFNMNNNNYETMKKTASFHDKYKSRIATRTMSEYFVKNEKNDLKIFLENTDVILISEKNVDLNDNELNEFLCSYKKVIDDKKINIILCENTKSYEY
ncbi:MULTISPECIES: DUF3867 domain-containing protein [Clostridium]|jgi:hypothetical protein|uniref:DUF3867 domain-containing protein n=1 Tax=Clostridium saccharoperbutylacetonicum N1-4(HMT) TaxID=931276 RepID=M1MKE2_9CLOT|nr:MULTISPECIES: DUF3867 domain-containing protein [Clostridium]AGF55266.1 hypothetical protein DUF3867 [Clostridium saccharoperbutylacetonicum N1-4(HMT)]AQR94152.1 hypothetical protein CLSAP_14590 [Clostridium saccharoperbutylacetonicum]NRT64022.1 hypothetical protein [Clostridium saccharoperbutylacetonicum]NSB27389.1 hypothetical protein [Clostridium saccharoperbutylacetonicum]NSB29851.1 hypothetical protein [Clostridium saccharoperbutylacetonicum]